MNENLIEKKIRGFLHGQTVFRYIEGENSHYKSLSELKEQRKISKIIRLNEKEWAIGYTGKSKSFRKPKRFEWHVYMIAGVDE